MLKPEYANHISITTNGADGDAHLVFAINVPVYDDNLMVTGTTLHEIASILIAGHTLKSLHETIESALNHTNEPPHSESST
ncbi:MAG: hypothetical protein FWC73_08250 [Defluviitaleaceae bacterium]|nr:hypothetical protein [Defluviitaleaceae bacterium]